MKMNIINFYRLFYESMKLLFIYFSFFIYLSLPHKLFGQTLITQNFESGTLTGSVGGTWTTTNTNAAATAWTIRSHGYAYSGGSPMTFNSPGGTYFILSNSDAGNSSGPYTTILKSASFSTVGYATANLSFRHYYRHYANSARVQVSTDNSIWTTLATYTSNQNTAASFGTVNISLNAYVGQATLYIRFNYTNNWDYYWAIDDISVTGTLSCTAPAAPGNPTSNSPQCNPPGVTITQSGSAPAGVTWYWQGTNSAGTSTALPSSSTYNATATGTYYIRAQDNTGLCWSATSGSVGITINSAPSVAAIGGGASSVCNGASTPAFTNATPGGTWSITNGTGSATITAGGVATGTSVGSVTVNYSVSNACGTTAVTAPLSVITVPAQPSAISGLTSPCSGSSQAYSVTNVAGVTYNWSFPSGGSPLWSQTGGGTTNSITASTGSASGNITVTPSNVCGTGTARTLAVTPGAGPTVLINGSNPATASNCGGAGVVITASGSTNYSWSPATGLSCTNCAAPTATPTSTTVYTVTETTSGCNNQATVTVKVGGAVTATASPSAATTVCPGSAVNLTSSGSESASTLLSQNFQSAIAPWTLTNTNVAAVAWTLRNSPYSASGQSVTSGSQFVLANSDAGGSGSSGTTTITSPSFSTIGYSTANLQFRHYYRYYGSESANVDVYNGSVWTTIATYTSTQGAYNAFATVNLSLNAYVGLANVQVRFRYVSSWDYGWSLDDIVITGTASPAFSYSWSSSPAGFTSSLQNPTANPSAATTYTVTATQTTSGCTGTASTVNVGIYPVPQGSLDAGPTVCSGAPAQLVWTATSGTGPFTVNYNPSSQSNSGVTSGVSFNSNNGTSAGVNTYTLTSVTDANGCTRSSGFTVGSDNVTANASPSAPTTTNGSRCSTGSVVLSASGAGAGESYKWYDALTGGTLLKTGANSADNTYTTASLTITTTFYVTKYQTASPFCESSPRIPVTAIINVGGLDAYTVTRTTGIAYSSISGTGTAVTNWRNTNPTGCFTCTLPAPYDENLSNALPIGFSFPFDAGISTQFLVSTNGFITFNTATKAQGWDLPSCGTGEPYAGDNSLFSGSPGKDGTLSTIAPFYNDLICVDASGNVKSNANTNIYYQTTGSAPNRVLTVEWKNMANDLSCDASCWEDYGDLNFQVKIYETSGNIEFIYGPTLVQTTYSTCDPGDDCTVETTYTAGINSSTLTTSATLTQLFVQQTDNSASFSSTSQNGLTTLPAVNSKITITRTAPPGATAAPTCGGAGMYPANGSTNRCTNTTLSWTAGDQFPTSYDVYFGTTNPPPFVQNQTAVYYDPGNLLSNTTYYWKIVPKNSFGDLGSPTVYSFTTGVPNSVTSITSSAGTNTGGNDYTVCSGTNTTLTPIGTLAENSAFNWTAPFFFDLGCNGIPYPLLGNCAMASDNNTYTNTGTSDDVYRYYIKARGCNQITSCQVMDITVKGVNTQPSVISSSSGNPICNGTTTTLSVTGTNLIAGATNRWYTGSCGGTLVGSGNSINVTPAATTTYYVRGEGGTTCPGNSSCRTLTITVNAAPTSDAGSSLGVCTGTAAITMTGSSAGGSVSSAAWSGGGGLGTWNNNGTPTNPADDYFTPSVGNGSFTATLTVTPVCSGSPATSTRLIAWNSTVAGECRWLGITSNDWFTASNWCNAIPTSTTDVVIPSGMPNNPDINGAGAVCRTITINTGATLSISGTNNLDVYGNWSRSGTFNPNSGTVTFRGSVNQSIGGSSANTFQNLTLNNTGTSGNNVITLSQPATVNGALTLTDGYLSTTTTNVLTLGSSATATAGSANSFVNGPLIKQGATAFVFPIGKNGKWARLRMSAPTASSDFRGEYFDNGYSSLTPLSGLGNVSSLEYWQLDRLAGTGNANVRLYWEDATWSQISDCNTNGDLVVAHWSAGSWNDIGSPTVIAGCTGGTAPSTGWIQSNSVTSFSPFTFATRGGANPLPVELVYFYSFCEDEVAYIHWTTATETNNDFFILERSYDGLNFTAVSTIRGAGNSSVRSNYEFIDLLDGIADKNTIYYRLKQTDFDGSFKYSEKIVTECLDPRFELITIMPNPTRSNFTVFYNAANHNEPVHLEVRDMLGRQIHHTESFSKIGGNTMSIDISYAKPGVYLVIIKSDNAAFIEKIIKN